MKKDIIVQARFKTEAECQVLIKQLNALDEQVVTSTYEDLLAGRIGKKTLRPLIDLVSFKMKRSADFQSVGDIYVAQALNDISNKIDSVEAFKFHLKLPNNSDQTSLSFENISEGKIAKEILLKLITEAGIKIQNHPDFKSSPGRFVSQALIEIGSGKDPATVLKLKKGSRNKNHMIDEQRIAYNAWYKIKIKGEKTICVFLDLATHDKSPALIKQYYNRYKNKITKMFMSIRATEMPE